MSKTVNYIRITSGDTAYLRQFKQVILSDGMKDPSTALRVLLQDDEAPLMYGVSVRDNLDSNEDSILEAAEHINIPFKVKTLEVWFDTRSAGLIYDICDQVNTLIPRFEEYCQLINHIDETIRIVDGCEYHLEDGYSQYVDVFQTSISKWDEEKDDNPDEDDVFNYYYEAKHLGIVDDPSEYEVVRSSGYFERLDEHKRFHNDDDFDDDNQAILESEMALGIAR